MADEFGLNQNILTGFDIDFLLSNLNLLNHFMREVHIYLVVNQDKYITSEYRKFAATR